MRLGLIGLGRIGSFHAETLTALPQVSSLVVADAAPGVASSLAARLGAEAADTPEALFTAGLDGVIIAAATDAHPELLLAAAKAGLPTFCEKPLAGRITDGLDVARRLSEAGVPVQVGYPRRYDAAFTAARDAVASGELGWVHTVRSTTHDPTPPPRDYLARSGGIFRDCAVHDFDAVRWVTGREVVSVYSTGSARGDAMFAELGDVASAATILTLDDDARALVSNARYNARGHDVRLEVHGSADSVAAGLEDSLPLRSVEPGATFPSGTPHVFFMDRFADAFRSELTAFTELVAGQRTSPCTVEDAMETGWVAEAATLSLAQNRPVALDEIRERL
ncbi:MAG: Gfo/Idh/MocA family oxidoreductase [Pseudonocardia sp.]|nr:Gfo/Idh/MocA family oxidoreductase [Pseudonocardia sp.]